ncbi:hypothetical protein [Leptospira interrogans]|uniref:hypothetical protein n=1 Tax=Leptospira interrogans TaxID=173 RepID=UPI0002BBB829|nr:hypothetical protein [Leptospira interrogans]
MSPVKTPVGSFGESPSIYQIPKKGEFVNLNRRISRFPVFFICPRTVSQNDDLLTSRQTGAFPK